MDPTDRLEIAVRLAPAFAFKFDYSDSGMPGSTSDFDKLADLSFKAADALIAKDSADKAKKAAK
jgi:hypothetical protein